MNRSANSRLASEVSVSVAGVGSYLPEHRVSNDEILKSLRPARPDGRLLEPEWVVKHLGQHSRTEGNDEAPVERLSPNAAQLNVSPNATSLERPALGRPSTDRSRS